LPEATAVPYRLGTPSSMRTNLDIVRLGLWFGRVLSPYMIEA